MQRILQTTGIKKIYITRILVNNLVLAFITKLSNEIIYPNSHHLIPHTSPYSSSALLHKDLS